MALVPQLNLFRLGGRALELIRRGAARHLDVVPAVEEVRRGDGLSVTVKAADASKAGELEAGLVCTETYATFMPQKELTVSDRRMLDATAYEVWVPVGATEQQVTLEVPLDGPYSYNGEHLKFVWRVAVRQQRRGLDAVRTREIRVLP